MDTALFSPSIKAMLERTSYPALAGPELDDFIDEHDTVALVFAEGIKRLPEADDLAVILPELVQAFDGRFDVAVVPFPAHRDMQLKYRFLKLPTLVFVRDGEYLGAISGLLDWADYLAEIERILAAQPSEPPPMPLPGGVADAQPQH